jgi:hypothetical protein
MIAIAPLNSAEPSRARRVGELLVFLWVLGIADLILTLWAHQYTHFFEGNPIARAMLAGQQIHKLIAFKISTLLVATTAFWMIRCHRLGEFALWSLLVVYLCVASQWFDYTADAMAVVK